MRNLGQNSELGMNRIIWIGFSILIFTGITSFKVVEKEEESKVKWHSIEEVQELLKTEKRKVYIDIYTDWCGWCKVMDKKTFTNDDIAELLNTKFYAVKLDGEGKEDINFRNHTFKFVAQGRNGYHELAAALLQGKMSYPTSVFLDENLNVLTPLPGYQTPEKLEPILTFIGDDIYKSKSYEDYIKNQ